ncbi:predicted protein [Chaetomium globosum CBS 148.51]|uniref:Uncharacterized protein n=1 Tax=Chaetomium globosum (strain ATCC 6205 / CBS 148.51 / DSM 1962 / NBRC 6347 / NRRL 1970) TaxID=306901 RepID=Q2H9U5_CHAGB|nr:uncharacterized protein CHGG_03009 [Chaetomium globosum CBS 148.51]EAQ91074.1 predicted protein [Chaetomium globosum CBS 148.51]
MLPLPLTTANGGRYSATSRNKAYTTRDCLVRADIAGIGATERCYDQAPSLTERLRAPLYAQSDSDKSREKGGSDCRTNFDLDPDLKRGSSWPPQISNRPPNGPEIEEIGTRTEPSLHPHDNFNDISDSDLSFCLLEERAFLLTSVWRYCRGTDRTDTVVLMPGAQPRLRHNLQGSSAPRHASPDSFGAEPIMNCRDLSLTFPPNNFSNPRVDGIPPFWIAKTAGFLIHALSASAARQRHRLFVVALPTKLPAELA